MEKVIFLAGGCFWGVEAYYKLHEGVISTECGYANGNFANPSYEEVRSQLAKHSEAVQIIYDNSLISLKEILDFFFEIINPYNIDHQGGDYGHQYRTGIYYNDGEDEQFVKNYIINKQKESSEEFAIEISYLENFYLAEEYHQDYLDKNPNGYCHIDLKKYKK